MNETKKVLESAPFITGDMVRGEDGELYHLPTLRTLHAAGRLSFGSVGYMLLMQRSLQMARLIA